MIHCLLLGSDRLIPEGSGWRFGQGVEFSAVLNSLITYLIQKSDVIFSQGGIKGFLHAFIGVEVFSPHPNTNPPQY